MLYQYIVIILKLIFIMLKIKQIRKEKNVSQDVLAQKTGISKGMIINYEKEVIDIPIKKLIQIANILEVNVWELIETSDYPIQELNRHINSLSEPSSEYTLENALRETIAILKNDVAEERKTNDFLKKVIESKLFT